jgi:acyl-CoA thioester hydrolase
MVQVRFSETDALGHVNNTSYFIYLEEARIKFLQSLGYDMSMENWRFILASTTCNFVGQAYFLQTLKIYTSVGNIGTKSFELHHRILDEKTENVIAEGTAILVYFDYHEQKSKPIPELLRTELERHLAVS